MIRKNRDLTVQLGTTQQQLAAAQKALQAEQEKTQRLVAAVTVSSLGARGAKAGSKSAAGAAGVDDGCNSNSGSKSGGGSSGSEGAAAASSAAVARVYDKLHQKQLAMAEVQRENVALRSLIQREVGLRDDTKEVNRLLRRATAVSSNGGSAAAAAGGTSASGADGGGWRGRAEEIVLLKSKLKDAQREVEEMAAAQSSSENGTDACTDPLSLPASVRAFLGASGDPAAEARSVVTTTTAQVRRPRRDVDDDARDRLSAMQQQRAAQQRQLAADLAELQQQLNEERMRSSALQARTKTMKSELDTLRSYVDTILEKSSTDDELVEAYKTELQRAHEEARHWRRVAADALKEAGGGKTSAALTVSGVHNGLNNAAAAAVRTAPYRKAAGDEKAVAAGGGDAGNVRGAPLPLPPPQPLTSFSRSLYEWVCQACDEVPEGKEQERTEPAVAASAKQLAAVLRQAFQHLVLVEQHTVAGNDMGHASTDSASSESILLKENAALKTRIRALSELMEKELQAQRVLWATAAAGAGATPSTETKERERQQ
ncbi:conserved hypothetical protein [Leishmania major strain Friedlin]|uniref:Uncharacterized protein n=1 Tax=Leishmania major TaxID=5664 RepID=Q4QFC9_LEIMA|nr:conserved hypothetical protein [Leishmania major strain Friedlin]CAG9571402.1 hypothetical_protein_-_conserved [Leishmania major strain Friedlin]CAJ03280.1 conserved hypothetical protein [Leishmania major strain Friedlin]|eukprot:XP_001681969.1 conserved hypothetical protein [Leishmania major strain Friedlin]